jgi:choline dehydrogenase-like flavoprotein
MDLAFVQFSPPTHFGTRYGDELKAADNIEILLHANATEIVASEDARAVERIDVATLNGLRHQVVADTVVLATGGLENPRMLLLSDSVMPQGLGNRHDLVGRFFMEHPHLTGFGEIVVADIERLPPIYRRRTAIDGHDVSAAFVPSERHLREHRLYNATFMIGEGGKSTADGAGGHPYARAHRDVLRATARLIDGGKASASNGDVIGSWLGIGCACEQAPNPDSRVTLGDGRDALGLRKIHLDWRLGELDRRSLVAHVHNLAIEFAALGIGRMRVDIEDPASWPDIVAGGSHHMGTTRMHDDPRQGVVDRDCRVHGLDNLYVAGGSVFPTGGAANPTLTIVALVLRLADHLKARGL